MNALRLGSGIACIAGAMLAIVGFGGCAEDDHEHGEEYAQTWNDAYDDHAGGKADTAGCSGVTVPDQSGFAKRVSLTFDDGPSPTTTPQVLDTLAQHGIPATFFINGNRVRGAAEEAILARMRSEGHILANHSHQHKNLKQQSYDEVDKQISLTHSILVEQGEDKLYFRFPFGSSSCTTAEQARGYGYIVAGWHVDTADWCFASGTGGVGYCATSTFRHVPDAYRGDMVGLTLSQVRQRSGGIVLFHDIHQNTADQLPAIIDGLKAEGYTFVNLDDIDAFPVLNGKEVPFIGDICEEDADCDFSGPYGVATCHANAKFCTLECEGFCPDQGDKAPTFCTSLDGGQSGSCVSKAGSENENCASIPGTEARSVDRYIGSSTASASSAVACVPVQ